MGGMFGHIDTAAKALNIVRREMDHNGSPATIDAKTWLVCFVPGVKKEWWHPFVHHTHKHVFAMRPEADGRWTLLDPWRHRLLTASLSTDQARRFLTWAAAGDVVAVSEDIPGESSQVRGWMTCAALVSYLLGRPYRVWTPHRLYRLLSRELKVLHVNPFALLELHPAELSAAVQAIASPADLLPPAKGLLAAPRFAFTGGRRSSGADASSGAGLCHSRVRAEGAAPRVLRKLPILVVAGLFKNLPHR